MRTQKKIKIKKLKNGSSIQHSRFVNEFTVQVHPLPLIYQSVLVVVPVHDVQLN